MACEMQISHKAGPPAVTTITCGGACDPVYRKTEKTEKGKTETVAEAVKRTCKRITPVTFDEKGGTFKFGGTYCACVIESAGDFCHYAPETDPTNPSKLKKAQCVGSCEELFYDKEFKNKVTSTCAMIIEPDNTIKCVCYSV